MEQVITLSDFIKRMASLGGDVEAAVIRGMQSSASRLVELVVHEIDHSSPHPAVDRGELRNSVEAVYTEKGARVVIKAPHAHWIEDGTRPHWPPFQPIFEWVVRKQLATNEETPEMIAQRVRAAIAKRGIEPRHFLAKAFARFVAGKYLGREVGRELEALAVARGKGRTGQSQRRGSKLRTKKGGGE